MIKEHTIQKKLKALNNIKRPKMESAQDRLTKREEEEMRRYIELEYT